MVTSTAVRFSGLSLWLLLLMLVFMGRGGEEAPKDTNAVSECSRGLPADGVLLLGPEGPALWSWVRPEGVMHFPGVAEIIPNARTGVTVTEAGGRGYG